MLCAAPALAGAGSPEMRHGHTMERNVTSTGWFGQPLQPAASIVRGLVQPARLPWLWSAKLPWGRESDARGRLEDQRLETTSRITLGTHSTCSSSVGHRNLPARILRSEHPQVDAWVFGIAWPLHSNRNIRHNRMRMRPPPRRTHSAGGNARAYDRH